MRDEILEFVRSAAHDRYLPAYREPWTSTVASVRYMAATDGTCLRWTRLQDHEPNLRPAPIPEWHKYVFMEELPGKLELDVQQLAEWVLEWSDKPDKFVEIVRNTLRARGHKPVLSSTRGGLETPTMLAGEVLHDLARWGIMFGATHVTLSELNAWCTQEPTSGKVAAIPARPLRFRFGGAGPDVLDLGYTVSALVARRSKASG